MIDQVSIEEIKRDVQAYLRRVRNGDTIIITDAGEPMAEIKPVQPTHGLRPYGLGAGDFVVPADFDEPLPEAILGNT
jgi:prevent-host-death family protein